jgi:hypothetical protein
VIFKKIFAGLFLLLTGLLLPIESISQSRINGKILDNLGNPIAYANVLLLSPMDSVIVKGSVSEENGNFHFDQIDQNSYLLSVSFMGMQNIPIT